MRKTEKPEVVPDATFYVVHEEYKSGTPVLDSLPVKTTANGWKTAGQYKLSFGCRTVFRKKSNGEPPYALTARDAWANYIEAQGEIIRAAEDTIRHAKLLRERAWEIWREGKEPASDTSKVCVCDDGPLVDAKKITAGDWIRCARCGGIVRDMNDPRLGLVGESDAD